MEDGYNTALDETVAYYDRNASAFVDGTFHADVSGLYELFEGLLPAGARVLDLGCGSGRDSRYFAERGYDVVAVDPSFAMCEQTKAVAAVPVIQMKAEEIQFSGEFDAVWACASLLHIPRENQTDVLHRIERALKPGGICYASWKYGTGDRYDGGRHFTDLTEDSFRSLLREIPQFEEVKVWITNDVRSDRQDQKWLNVLLRKGGALAY